MSMHRGFEVAGIVRWTLAVCTASALIAGTALTPIVSVHAQTAPQAQAASPQAQSGDAAKPWPGPPITSQTDANDPPARVGRIARMSGTVSFHTADEDQWGPATLNYPLTGGNALWTEPGARAELQIGSANRLVMDGSTELNVIALDDGRFEAGLPQGSAYLNVGDVAPGESYTLQTPRGSVEIAEPGRYLVTAGDDDKPTTVTALDRGSARLSGRGMGQTVPAGQTATLAGPLDGDAPITVAFAPAQSNAFARSALQDETGPVQAAAAPSQQRVPVASTPMPAQVQGMTGAQDLAAYGSWSSAPDYGTVWYPPVETGWVPYRHGHWAYVPPWGWTWVADEPWGFAPFHYGRWVMVHDRWAWSPGGVVHVQYHRHRPRPVYAPALVAFFGTGSGISVSIVAGNVGWVPLGWREAYYPPYRVSRNYIRNVNVTHVTNITRVTNVTNVNNVTVNRYVNRGSATVVSADAMRRSQPVDHALQRVDNRQIESARVDRRARIEPAAATAGMSPRTAERMGIRDGGGEQPRRREAPGPQIRQNDLRNTDLRPAETRAANTRPQEQQRAPRAEMRDGNRRQADQVQQRAVQPQQRAGQEPQRQATERQQQAQGPIQERQRQETQRQDQRRQDVLRQQQESQRRMQDHQRQQQDVQQQAQERRRREIQRQEQQRQAGQQQMEMQRQQLEQRQRQQQEMQRRENQRQDSQRQMQQQRDTQQRQQDAQQRQQEAQHRQQDVRRQQDAEDQRRQRREQN